MVGGGGGWYDYNISLSPILWITTFDLDLDLDLGLTILSETGGMGCSVGRDVQYHNLKKSFSMQKVFQTHTHTLTVPLLV